MKTKKLKLIILGIFGIHFCISFSQRHLAWANPPSTKCGSLLDSLRPNADFQETAQAHLSRPKLIADIADRRSRVPEFEFLREEAQRRGLRVWLFGGTAAGYGYYVKWDSLRELGDTSFQPDRFDYDYTNIYRATQDLDIVVDGSANDALLNRLSNQLNENERNKIEAELAQRFYDQSYAIPLFETPPRYYVDQSVVSMNEREQSFDVYLDKIAIKNP